MSSLMGRLAPLPAASVHQLRPITWKETHLAWFLLRTAVWSLRSRPPRRTGDRGVMRDCLDLRLAAVPRKERLHASGTS